MLYSERINKVRLMMKEKSICAVYVSSPENVFYLSGFTGFGDARLFITGESATIITDSRYTLQVKEQCPDFTLVLSSALNVAAIENIIKEEKVSTVGFEESIEYKSFRELTEKFGSIDFVSVGNFFIDIRDIKNEIEIKNISEACRISVEALKEVLPLIKPGAFEADVATELEYLMKKKGAQDKAFDIIVASGARSALPHGVATYKKIEYSDTVTIDFGCKFNNYCSDMTRTFFVGKPADEMKKIYNIVYEAQMAALAGYKAGITGKELDSISRKIISKAGYGEHFGHSLGHGVGLEIHEGVTIGQRNETKIEKGMVFSVEPGIYIENVGGVRIEDLVYAEENYIKNFTDSFDKKMLVL